MRHIRKTVSKILIWTALTVVFISAGVQIMLTPKVLTPIIEKYAARYIDATVDFGGVSVNMFSHFPNISVSIDSCTVTYGSDRFAGFLRRDDVTDATLAGSCRDSSNACMEDTLAVMAVFRATVNPFALLGHQLRIKQIDIRDLKGYAHRFDSTHVNWDIIKDMTAGGEESADTSGTGATSRMPVPVIGRISLGGRPTVLYTDEETGAMALATFSTFDFKGNRDSDESLVRDFRLKLDSLLVFGSLGGDSVAVSLDRLRLMSAGASDIAGDLEISLMAATRQYGRIALPASCSFRLGIPSEKPDTISVKSFDGYICGLPFSVEGDLGLCGDSIRVKASLDMEHGDIGAMVEDYGPYFSDILGNISTDATLDIHAGADGWYVPGTGELPDIRFTASIPKSGITHGPADKASIHLDCSGDNLQDGRLNLSLDTLDITAFGATRLNASARLYDLLGQDPLIEMNADASSDLSSLSDRIGSDSTFRFEGVFSGAIRGKARLSQLTLRHICEADLGGRFQACGINFLMPADSLEFHADTLGFALGAVENIKLDDMPKGSRVLLAGLSADTASIRLKGGMEASAARLKVRCHSDDAILPGQSADSLRIPRYFAQITSGRLSLMDRDSTRITLRDTDNKLTITSREGSDTIPVVEISSISRRVRMRGRSGRFSIRNLNLDAKAEKRTETPSGRISDSVRAVRRSDDFSATDYAFNLGDSFKKAYSSWNARGSIKLTEASLQAAAFPIRSSITGLGVSITTNSLILHKLRFRGGNTDLSLDGRVTGLRKALMNNGIARVSLNLDARSLDLNEIIAALAVGSAGGSPVMTEDEEDTPAPDTGEIISQAEELPSPLLVIPDFIDAAVNIKGRSIAFSDMVIDSLSTSIEMKDRCLKISNITAGTNMGDITFEGYYATKSKNDISAGVNLGLSGITASEVIGMIPSMDTLLPLLKTFDGRLNCYVAGTARLDTNMNILLPTATGVLRFGGDSLSLEQTPEIRKITRLLMFKNHKDLRVNKMSVEAQMGDDKIEIFPFILEVDRYKLAASGVQNMDNSCSYHLSVMKSPLPFRLGLDVYGGSFDDLHYRLVKPKYKNEEKIPVFSSTIDETRLNVSRMISGIFSIGVDKVVRDSTILDAVKKRRKREAYVPAQDIRSEEISSKELSDMKETASLSETNKE